MSSSPSPAPTAAKPIPIAEFAAKLLGSYTSEGYRVSTTSRVRTVLNELVSIAGVQTSSDLNDDAIKRFIEGQPDGQSHHTFWTNFSSARGICNKAVSVGLLPSCPEFPKIPQVIDRGQATKTFDDATPNHVQRFLNHLRIRSGTWEGRRLYTLVATITFAGLFRDEALKLRVEQCDLEEGFIFFPDREVRNRSIFPPHVRIEPTLVLILANWLPFSRSEWVFPGKTRVGPWTGGKPGVRPLHQLQEEGRECGWPGVTFESLRRFHLAHAVPNIPIVAHDPLPALAGETLQEEDPQPSSPSWLSSRAGRPGQAPELVETAEVATSPSWSTAPRSPAESTPGRRTKATPITPDEATRLMVHLLQGSETWDGHRLYAVVGTALLTGLRKGEVLNLRVDDCDLEGGSLRIPQRPLPCFLRAEAKVILAEWLPNVAGRTPWLFPGTKLMGPWIGGRPGEKPTQRLKKAARAVGLEGVTFESLRRHHNQSLEGWLLSEEFGTTAPPTRFAEGPQPRPPGPPPTRPRTAYPTSVNKPVPRPLVKPVVEWTPKVVEPQVPVVLFGPSDSPLVLGKVKPPLSKIRYRVVKALLDAGPTGLSKSQLVRGVTGDAWGVVMRLKKSDEDWDKVIHPPTDDGKLHYRIARPD